MHIIENVILKTIPASRSELSVYAPKIYTTNIDPEKIRDVIGPGGKIIHRIIAETGTKIDISEDGRVYVASPDPDAAERAIKIVEGITGDVKPGDIFTGKVMRFMSFGAFVEFLPGKEGLVHISKLDNKHTKKVEDVVNIGDVIPVKVLEIDKQGRINLSRKDALEDAADKKQPATGDKHVQEKNTDNGVRIVYEENTVFKVRIRRNLGSGRFQV